MLKHHLIRRTLTGGLVIAVVGLPASAQAMRIEAGAGPSAPAVSTTVRLPVDTYSSRALHPYDPASAASVQRASEPAFQWSDAAIGAAGAVLVMGAAATGVAITRRRRIQRALVG